MNINALRKNYDRLTPKERFAAICAADLRGDDQERKALHDTAPKKTFAIKHHYGFWLAFERLSMFHQIRQLENAGLLILASQIDKPQDPDGLFESICNLAKRYQTGAAAWAVLCKEYGIDPHALTQDLPGAGVLDWASRLAELLQDDQDLPELQAYLDDFRESIEKMAGDWA
jgi:hypothetical protein